MTSLLAVWASIKSFASVIAAVISKLPAEVVYYGLACLLGAGLGFWGAALYYQPKTQNVQVTDEGVFRFENVRPPSGLSFLGPPNESVLDTTQTVIPEKEIEKEKSKNRSKSGENSKDEKPKNAVSPIRYDKWASDVRKMDYLAVPIRQGRPSISFGSDINLYGYDPRTGRPLTFSYDRTRTDWTFYALSSLTASDRTLGVSVQLEAARKLSFGTLTISAGGGAVGGRPPDYFWTVSIGLEKILFRL